MTTRFARVARGTPEDLIRAAEMGARLASRWHRAAGLDDESIRRAVLTRFRADLEAESFGEYADETLMAAAQRAVAEVLGEAPQENGHCV